MISEEEYWTKIEVNKKWIKETLEIVKRDIVESKTYLAKESYDWAYCICYNAILQTGRALMFYNGYRPKEENKHISVIEFLKQFYSSEFEEQIIFLINKIRTKRHIAMYERINSISEDDLKFAISIAEEFYDRAISIIKI
ncbi:MAG: HEPN domain-containing protein [archaeon]|jgi:uncharacterized protein (UPF0332 family)